MFQKFVHLEEISNMQSYQQAALAWHQSQSGNTLVGNGPNWPLAQSSISHNGLPMLQVNTGGEPYLAPVTAGYGAPLTSKEAPATPTVKRARTNYTKEQVRCYS